MAAEDEGNQKALFSLTSTPRCKEGRYSFPGLLHFTLDSTLYGRVLSKEVSSTILKVFGMTQHGIEPRSPGPLANTILTRPMSRCNRTLAWWLKCLLIAQETWVQSQVASYQRLKKWYLIPPCLTLSIIRYVSKVSGANQWKE